MMGRRSEESARAEEQGARLAPREEKRSPRFRGADFTLFFFLPSIKVVSVLAGQPIGEREGGRESEVRTRDQNGERATTHPFFEAKVITVPFLNFSPWKASVKVSKQAP